MKKLKTTAGVLILLCTLGMKVYSQDTLHLQSNSLKLVIANNQAYGDFHRAGYNGISELYIRGNDDRSLFMAATCGLNLEFLFSGDSESYEWDRFEPRKYPMELTRLAPDRIQLKQSQTENWPLQSTITFRLSGNLVEMDYEGKALEDIWNKHNYIGIFFASYIQSPEEKGINFIGKTRSDSDSLGIKWIYHLPPSHGQEANHRPVGSNWDPPLDPGFPLTLVSGFSAFEYRYPFYYGRSGENVVIMMFKSPEGESELRFAQSPDGGGPDIPAWDFIYFKKGYGVNQPFVFKVGMIVKKFEGKEDVIREYEKWSGTKLE